MPSIADNEEYWLERASEARALADRLEDPEMKRLMLHIAEQYELLEAHARARNKAGQNPE